MTSELSSIARTNECSICSWRTPDCFYKEIYYESGEQGIYPYQNNECGIERWNTSLKSYILTKIMNVVPIERWNTSLKAYILTKTMNVVSIERWNTSLKAYILTKMMNVIDFVLFFITYSTFDVDLMDVCVGLHL